MISIKHFMFFVVVAVMAVLCRTPDAQQPADQARVGKSEQRFLRSAAQDGMAEVDMGTLAQSRASSAEVRELAGRVTQDRRRALDELHQLAESKGIEYQPAPDRAGRAATRTLGSRKGQDFDRRYLLTVMKDLDRDLRSFRKTAREAKDRDVKAFAAKHVALLEQQLDAVRKFADAGNRSPNADGSSIGGSSSGASK
jgi:putative membrane protein